MADYQRLPTEVWALIVSKSDQRSLNILALTSRWYRELATPQLYRRLMYWESKSNGTEILRGKNVECLSAKETSCLMTTRIFDPTALTKLLSNSGYLRSMIMSVDLIWDCAKDDTALYALLEVLNSSSLQNLHLSPADARFAIPASTCVTSLVLRRLPSLRHICFEDWDNFENGALPPADYLCTIIAPNITHLTFHLCEVSGGYLQAIVSRPAKLRSFKYSICQEEYTTLDSSDALLQSALNVHQQTLEEVMISVPFGAGLTRFDVQCPLRFNHFWVLKRLRINIEYLLPGFTAGSTYTGQKYKIHESLPRTLEHLELEYFRRSISSNMDDYLAVDDDFKGLVGHIDELIVNVSKYLPMLKNLGLDGTGFSTAESSYFMEHIWRAAEDLKRMGVQLGLYDPTEMRGFSKL